MPKYKCKDCGAVWHGWGAGGVCCAKDAIEMFLAGARAVQVGSANFSNPYIMLEIISGIKRYLKERKYNSIRDIIGLVKDQDVIYDI